AGALPLLQRAHGLQSSDPEIAYHLALALDATGKRDDAKALLKAVLARNSNFSDARNAQELLARW
ncbi:MAG: tetratricopeptide repeat protein, partial [Bryobacteraceae bacterium]